MYTLFLIFTTYLNLGITQQLLDIRLAGGSTNYSGRVEILSQTGEWGTVCDDSWDLKDAIVVCRQLGFDLALEAPTEATFGEGNGPIYLDDVECEGNEDTLFHCNSGNRQNCDHNEDAGVVCLNVGDHSNQTIRLTGGQTSSEGRVELFRNGEWGTVCGNGWDIDDATVVCRQLGLNSALQFQTNAFFGEGTGPIWMANIRCTGYEADISDCSHDIQNSCTHSKDASVTCAGKATIENIRLSNGGTVLEGRVEVMINGQWGTICDDLWSIEDGHVVCKELGYLAAIAITTDANFGPGGGPIWFDNVACTGNEVTIADCTSSDLGSHDCNHDEDAGVRCLSEATYSDIRLTGSMTKSEGRLEILLNGQWGTVCDDSWDLTAANVVCKELGYSAAEHDSVSAKYGEGVGPIWLDDVRCHGDEYSLTACSHNGIGRNDCGHHEDVGVKCQELGSSLTIENIRLSGGSTVGEGRVEIFVAGEWGTICDDMWDIYDADVACRELGFDSALEATNNAYFGEGIGPIWLDNVECVGGEANVSDCSKDELGLHNCEHIEDAGVKCLLEIDSNKIVLTGGTKPGEGTLEVLVNGKWKALCNDEMWGIANSFVVCRQLGYDSALSIGDENHFVLKSASAWTYNFQCSGREAQISDCPVGKYASNYTCEAQLVGVTCLSHDAGGVYTTQNVAFGTSTDRESQAVKVLANWVYIVVIAFLVIIILSSVIIGLVMYRRNSQRRRTNFSQQRPLPNSPQNCNEDYVRMHPSSSCFIATEEKTCLDYDVPMSAISNTYTSAFEQTGHNPTVMNEDTTYETTIFDSSGVDS